MTYAHWIAGRFNNRQSVPGQSTLAVCAYLFALSTSAEHLYAEHHMSPNECSMIVSAMRTRQNEFVQDAMMRSAALRARGGRSVDPAYTSSLPSALHAAYGFFIGSIESGVSTSRPIPPLLLTQVHTAAVVGVALDELLRRSLAINSLLTVYLSQAAEGASLGSAGRLDLARTQAAAFEHLMDTMVIEFQRVTAGQVSEQGRRLKHVQGLLAGDQLSPVEMQYDFSYFHTAVVAFTPERRILTGLAKALDARLLIVELDESVVWAWLGSRSQAPASALRSVASENFQGGSAVAFGSSEPGLRGWRSSHLQAKTAFLLSMWRRSVLHYEDVAVEAAALQNETLSSFLRLRYLKPIQEAPCDHAVLFDTLRAYFEVERNGVSAATVLGVSRQTVSNRLRLVEKYLGCPLGSCADKVDLALRLEEVERHRTAAAYC